MWRARTPRASTSSTSRTFRRSTRSAVTSSRRSNVPLVFPKYDREGALDAGDGAAGGARATRTPTFVAEVQEVCGPGDTILVCARPAAAEAMAVTRSRSAGFTKAYNIRHAASKGRVDDPGSVFHGKHMRNRLEERRTPWGYDFPPRT